MIDAEERERVLHLIANADRAQVNGRDGVS
jgi:hypothetical protein